MFLYCFRCLKGGAVLVLVWLLQHPGQEKEQFDLQEKKGKHNHLLFALYLLHTR